VSFLSFEIFDEVRGKVGFIAMHSPYGFIF
jgi:hypothetical protein